MRPGEPYFNGKEPPRPSKYLGRDGYCEACCYLDKSKQPTTKQLVPKADRSLPTTMALTDASPYVFFRGYSSTFFRLLGIGNSSDGSMDISPKITFERYMSSVAWTEMRSQLPRRNPGKWNGDSTVTEILRDLNLTHGCTQDDLASIETAITNGNDSYRDRFEARGMSQEVFAALHSKCQALVQSRTQDGLRGPSVEGPPQGPPHAPPHVSSPAPPAAPHAAPYATTHAAPYATTHAAPYATTHAAPYVTTHAAPYAPPHASSPAPPAAPSHAAPDATTHAAPYADPYAPPYAAPDAPPHASSPAPPPAPPLAPTHAATYEPRYAPLPNSQPLSYDPNVQSGSPSAALSSPLAFQDGNEVMAESRAGIEHSTQFLENTPDVSSSPAPVPDRRYLAPAPQASKEQQMQTEAWLASKSVWKHSDRRAEASAYQFAVGNKRPAENRNLQYEEGPRPLPVARQLQGGNKAARNPPKRRRTRAPSGTQPRSDMSCQWPASQSTSQSPALQSAQPNPPPHAQPMAEALISRDDWLPVDGADVWTEGGMIISPSCILESDLFKTDEERKLAYRWMNKALCRWKAAEHESIAQASQVRNLAIFSENFRNHVARSYADPRHSGRGIPIVKADLLRLSSPRYQEENIPAWLRQTASSQAALFHAPSSEAPAQVLSEIPSSHAELLHDSEGERLWSTAFVNGHSTPQALASSPVDSMPPAAFSEARFEVAHNNMAKKPTNSISPSHPSQEMPPGMDRDTIGHDSQDATMFHSTPDNTGDAVGQGDSLQSMAQAQVEATSQADQVWATGEEVTQDDLTKTKWSEEDEMAFTRFCDGDPTVLGTLPGSSDWAVTQGPSMQPEISDEERAFLLNVDPNLLSGSNEGGPVAQAPSMQPSGQERALFAAMEAVPLPGSNESIAQPEL